MSISYSIRLLTAEDKDAYHDLWLQALAEYPGAFGDDEQEAQLRFEKPWHIYVPPPVYGAYVGAALAGIIGSSPNNRIKKRHIAGIGPLYVAPQYRRQGIAHALLAYAIAKLPPYVEQIRLGAHTANQPAMRFYESEGFTGWGTEVQALRLRDGTYADIVWMTKNLL
jgi:GNAT superfamily N-acetyltransferase